MFRGRFGANRCRLRSLKSELDGTIVGTSAPLAAPFADEISSEQSTGPIG
jgi:hypothetical protein